MKVFEIRRIKCRNNLCKNFTGHNGYLVAGHNFSPLWFERITGRSWERGVRRFRLVEVRSKKVSKRG